ncbi:MAG: indole-3-glycerol phosphate synthase TrpC [Acidimicrobiales bacterium]
MVTYLDGILAAHRARAAAERPTSGQAWEEMLARARAGPSCRDFTGSLSRPGLSVIAEIKRRSPSKGDLAPNLDPAHLAGEYERGGAAALSVLTDAEFFGGSPADLAAARNAVDLPVLRKDFTISQGDICAARLMGADAVLLIVAALSRGELGDFLALVADIGLAGLVEVHDEAELGLALDAGATLIGVNQRDLATFEVDQDRAARLCGLIPNGVIKVAESGLSGPDEAGRLYRLGYDAVLVGESLVRAPRPARAVADLVEAAKGDGAPGGAVSIGHQEAPCL